MGLAVEQERLAIGTTAEITEFRNFPEVTAKLKGPHQHDACFLPRTTHYTGNIQIHEMAWAGGDLLFLNTLFSCLCRRSSSCSFEPIWRPAFVDRYAPTDICHLNGLCVVDDAPGFVTALGETNTDAGWRSNKRDGGIVIDIAANKTVCSGLSMPHSPRWHENQLWILESGSGSLGTVDLSSGTYSPIAFLPGFTRGLAFCGTLAFVGLSQVRETAVFSDFPIADQTIEERNCGVWIVDIRNGEVVAFVKFQNLVQEIFSVELLPGMRFPDLINHDEDLIGGSYSLPEDALMEVPTHHRG